MAGRVPNPEPSFNGSWLVTMLYTVEDQQLAASKVKSGFQLDARMVAVAHLRLD